MRPEDLPLKLISDGARQSVQAPARQPIRARYENAQNLDDNQRSWWLADYLSAKSANNFQVRRQLRIRSRHEVSNNPYLYGVCTNNADDLIGAKGPTLKVTTKDESYNKAVEAAWQEWSQEVGLVEKLRTCKLARTVDGEGFLVLKTVSELESPVKLYPLDVEADQVTTPAPTNLTELWVDGLTLHPVTGRPTAYHVLKHHPGDYYFPDFSPLKVEKVPAKHVVHWYPKFRPGQVRGVPIFTPALDLFSELRAYRKAVLAKAQVAANLTAVLESEAPADLNDMTATGGTAAAPSPFSTVPIDRGMFTELPGGYKLNQFATGEPATTYEMFQQQCLGEAIRPLGYPLNLALGTSQKFNFSSAKLDHINYHKGLDVERSDCERVVLECLFAAFLIELALAHSRFDGATMAGTPHEWHWPGYASIDPESDARTDIARLNGGVQTWQRFWAERGYDWREVMAQQDQERKEIERLGLTFGEPLKKTEKVDDTQESAPHGKPPKKGAQASKARPFRAGEWNEKDHPRDEAGRFGEGGSQAGTDGPHAETHEKWEAEDTDREAERDDKLSEVESRRDEWTLEIDEREEEAQGKLADRHERENDKVERTREKEDCGFAKEERQIERDYDQQAKAFEKEKTEVRKAIEEEEAAEQAEAEKAGASEEEREAITEKWDRKHDEELDRIGKREVAYEERTEQLEKELEQRQQAAADKREAEDAEREARQAAEVKAIEEKAEAKRRKANEGFDEEVAEIEREYEQARKRADKERAEKHPEAHKAYKEPANA